MFLFFLSQSKAPPLHTRRTKERQGSFSLSLFLECPQANCQLLPSQIWSEWEIRRCGCVFWKRRRRRRHRRRALTDKITEMPPPLPISPTLPFLKRHLSSTLVQKLASSSSSKLRKRYLSHLDRKLAAVVPRKGKRYLTCLSIPSFFVFLRTGPGIRFDVGRWD